MSKLTLKQPFSITSGLYPGIRIGDATLECREALQFVVYFHNGEEYQIEGFQPGAFADLQDCFASILGFLSAWSEAIDFTTRTGVESENLDLFDRDNQQLVDWATENSDEIEETEGLIEEA